MLGGLAWPVSEVLRNPERVTMMAEDRSRFCTQCGAVAAPENAFCGKCGGPIGPAAASLASPQPPAPMASTEGSASKRSIPRWAKLVAAVVVIAALVGLGYHQFAASSTHTVTGTVTITAQGPGDISSASVGTCSGAGGFSDLSNGASVTLRDEGNTILASTVLDAGKLPAGDTDTGIFSTHGHCSFGFTLTSVPDSAQFYSIFVSHRGGVTFSHQKIADAGWVMNLSI